MFHINSRKDSNSYSINFPQKTIILNGGMQVIVPQSSDAESTRTFKWRNQNKGKRSTLLTNEESFEYLITAILVRKERFYAAKMVAVFTSLAHYKLYTSRDKKS